MTRCAFLVTLTRTLVVAAALLNPAALSAHDEFRFVGSVVRMDTAKNVLTITIKEEGKDVTLRIAMTSKIPVERDGQKVARATLKAGLYVVVDALGHDYDDLEAVAVKIVPAPPR